MKPATTGEITPQPGALSEKAFCRGFSLGSVAIFVAAFARLFRPGFENALKTAATAAGCAALCLFLTACNGSEPAIHTGNKTADSLDKLGLYPFAATGLTTRPNETAEEILHRAVMGDARASALVTAGYAYGIGGFPRSKHIARSWGAHSKYLGAFEVFSFNRVLLSAGGYLDENDPGKVLADCQAIKGAPLAENFKSAGIFDAQAYCARLQSEKKPEWEESYIQNLNTALFLKDLSLQSRLLARKTTPLTPEENAIIEQYAKFTSPGAAVFLAAYGHNPDREAPGPTSTPPEPAPKKSDGDKNEAEEMLALYHKLYGDPYKPPSRQWHNITGYDALAIIKTSALPQYLKTLEEGRTPSKETLENYKLAHTGDPRAAKTLSETYPTFQYIFPDKEIRWAWILQPGVHITGGETSRLFQTTFVGKQDDPVIYSLWAHLVVENAKVHEKRLTREMDDLKEGKLEGLRSKDILVLTRIAGEDRDTEAELVKVYSELSKVIDDQMTAEQKKSFDKIMADRAEDEKIWNESTAKVRKLYGTVK